MFVQLGETLELIKEINQTNLPIKKINQEVIKEQEENLEDLKDLLERYSKATKTLKDKEIVERDDLTAFIVEVHIILGNLGWHINQIKELLANFSRSLPSLEEE